MAFKGKPPGFGSGEMSGRTRLLRPNIALDKGQALLARRLRRLGQPAGQIAESMKLPIEEVEKALVQMRTRRPETTRGTLNVTLAAHQLVMRERLGGEPIWRTVDRMFDELLELRGPARPSRRRKPRLQ